MRSQPRAVVVMGVAGAGKTTIGRRLAAALDWPFYDADDFHPAANVARMAAGITLTDEERQPWLTALNRLLTEHLIGGRSLVLACSALKAVYRDRLSAGDGPDDLIFVHLKGSRELIFGRMAARQGHYMPVSLLDSQLAILEETPDLWTVAIDREPEAITAEILDRLAAPRP